jgi:hypothetical protein
VDTAEWYSPHVWHAWISPSSDHDGHILLPLLLPLLLLRLLLL